MFWGRFSGASSKGPGIFWEKEQGSIYEGLYEDKQGLEEKSLYDKLRRYVKEAWDALPDSYWQVT